MEHLAISQKKNNLNKEINKSLIATENSNSHSKISSDLVNIKDQDGRTYGIYTRFEQKKFSESTTKYSEIGGGVHNQTAFRNYRDFLSSKSPVPTYFMKSKGKD